METNGISISSLGSYRCLASFALLINLNRSQLAVAYYLFNLIISLIKNKGIKNANLMLRLTGAYNNGSLLTWIRKPDMPQEDISLATYKYVGWEFTLFSSNISIPTMINYHIIIVIIYGISKSKFRYLEYCHYMLTQLVRVCKFLIKIKCSSWQLLICSN